MRVEVVGVQHQDYKMDTGYSFKGRKIHCIDKDTVTGEQLGFQVTTIRLADDSRFSSISVEVGKEYTVYFNQKGGVDFLAELDCLL